MFRLGHSFHSSFRELCSVCRASVSHGECPRVRRDDRISAVISGSRAQKNRSCAPACFASGGRTFPRVRARSPQDRIDRGGIDPFPDRFEQDYGRIVQRAFSHPVKSDPATPIDEMVGRSDRPPGFSGRTVPRPLSSERHGGLNRDGARAIPRAIEGRRRGGIDQTREQIFGREGRIADIGEIIAD